MVRKTSVFYIPDLGTVICNIRNIPKVDNPIKLFHYSWYKRVNKLGKVWFIFPEGVPEGKFKSILNKWLRTWINYLFRMKNLLVKKIKLGNDRYLEIYLFAGRYVKILIEKGKVYKMVIEKPNIEYDIDLNKIEKGQPEDLMITV